MLFVTTSNIQKQVLKPWRWRLEALRYLFLLWHRLWGETGSQRSDRFYFSELNKLNKEKRERGQGGCYLRLHSAVTTKFGKALSHYVGMGFLKIFFS